MGEAIVFTSGKGGVGKTTTIANIGAGLSRLDKKVIMLDTDMGLRNLDVVMGMEDQIQYNLIDLLENKCRLKQALIRDKRYPNLFMIPAALRCRKIMDYESKLYTLCSTGTVTNTCHNQTKQDNDSDIIQPGKSQNKGIIHQGYNDHRHHTDDTS
jgi:CO dehydrogenase nickel-insertion accessory protein CooC1